MATPISHAVVLPDRDFESWLSVMRDYMQKFERVAVVRSPAGNDLNRFRNVTAVETPNVWFNDDALSHIRRAYPSVVRVDIIKADRPRTLGIELNERVIVNDRFGEKRNNPRHIYDRFVLEWMSPARPTRITRPFSTSTDKNPDKHEGFDVLVFPDAEIVAAAEGVVTRVVPNNDGLNYGAYIQVTSNFDGETYIVTYAGLTDISVALNQTVVVGKKLALAEGETIKIVVQKPGDGLDGFKLPDVVDPIFMVYWQGLRLRPMVTALRVRDKPGTHGDVIGTVSSTDLLETQELHGRTLAKLDVEGQWIRIRRAGTNNAFVAAWFLEARGLDDPAEAIPGVKIPGVNLDLAHHQGAPDPIRLKGMGWVRLKFNVSLNPAFPEGDDRRYGNTDVDATFNRYRPILERYRAAGIKVIMILGHQTFGEGQGYVWPQMHTGLWQDLTHKFANVVKQTAQKFVNTGLVYAYQIWNEQDTPPELARAAVAMPPQDYGYLLAETIKTIRAVDREIKIITGGLVQGPELGASYIRAAFKVMPANIRPDGVAFHPYGRGAADDPFSVHGTIGHAVNVYSRVLPGRPVWITEWGILNRQGDESIVGQATQYMRGFFRDITTGHPGQVACAIWYAWADGMDNGYGLVRGDGSAREPLYSTFLKQG